MSTDFRFRRRERPMSSKKNIRTIIALLMLVIAAIGLGIVIGKQDRLGDIIVGMNDHRDIQRELAELKRRSDRLEQELTEALSSRHQLITPAETPEVPNEAIATPSEKEEQPGRPPEIDGTPSLMTEPGIQVEERKLRRLVEQQEKEGREALEKAVEAARHRGVLTFLNDTEKSLAAYREVVRLASNSPDAWKRIGLLLHRKGELDEAEAALDKALSLGRQANDKRLIADALGNLGNIAFSRRDLGTADNFHRESLAINQFLERDEGMAADFGNLGNVALARGKLDKAEYFFVNAREIGNRLHDQERVAIQYANLGVVAIKRHKYPDAKDDTFKALKINEELKNKEGMAANYSNLGLIAKTDSDLAGACRCWADAHRLYAEVSATPRAERVRGWMIEAECGGIS